MNKFEIDDEIRRIACDGCEVDSCNSCPNLKLKEKVSKMARRAAEMIVKETEEWIVSHTMEMNEMVVFGPYFKEKNDAIKSYDNNIEFLKWIGNK